MKKYIRSSVEEVEEVEELDRPEQEFDSADTSINSNKLPAVYKMINIPEGTVGVDFGGGRFDNAVEHIRDLGATLCVYDPYNRTAEHNREVLKTLRRNGGADWAVNSNVLNVIKENEARKAVLENIKKITKPGAPIYITVYEGRGDGKDGPTKSGYQLNRKTADYLEEIQQVLPDAKRKGKLIIAHNFSSADSSTEVTSKKKRILSNEDSIRYIALKKNFSKQKVFKDREKESGNIKDLTDDLTNKNVEWEIYENKTDNGCVVFYEPYQEEVYAAKDVSNVLVKLRYELKTKADSLMSEFGFYENEIDQYLTIIVFPDKDSGYVKAEVRAELDYDDLVEMCDRLDSVIAKYDQDSYFEPEAPGIANAYLKLPQKTKKSTNDYTSYQSLYYNGQKYGVRSNDVEMFDDEDDAEDLLNAWKFQVSEIHPYDDREYFWAKGEKGVIKFVKSGKVVTRRDYMDADTMDLSNSEWFEAIIHEAMDELAKLNKDIEQKIIHNSEDLEDQPIEAGAYDHPEPSLDPPEYDDGEEIELTEECKFSLDGVEVEVSEDGSWEYNNYDFVLENCDLDGLHSDDLDVLLRDQDQLVEALDEIIEINIPEKPGKYKLSGECTLVFNASDIVVYTDAYSEDDYEQTIVTDNMNVELDRKKSVIEGLSVEPIE